MPPPNNSLASIGLFAIPVLYYIHKAAVQKSTKRTNNTNMRSSQLSSSANLSEYIRPPFPPIIRSMLSSCRLAYLSTVDGDSSHLSLMRFTYLKDPIDGEVVIMTTRRNTKKFDMLTKQRGVALLIHDFAQFDDADSNANAATNTNATTSNSCDDDNDNRGIHSITLNGQCIILEKENERTEMYRAAHLKHNQEYSQFIVGDEIAVLCVIISSGRICNINDQVTRWDAAASG